MERLHSRIERFIRAGDGVFDTLALELFAYQYAQNAPYRAYCESLEASPASVREWQDIPAVPVRAFKSAALTTFPPPRAAACFESSRTTGQAPSQHYLKDLLFYETACVKSFSTWVVPEDVKRPFLILNPNPGEAPRSSLAWMFDTVTRKLALSGDGFVLRGKLDEPRLVDVLKRMQSEGHPVVLLGTTLAFMGFFDYCQAKNLVFALPAGSRLMDTGGMKGSGRTFTRSQFVDQVVQRLGIQELKCVNEYGMCEMSSQFYGKGKSSVLEGPAWVRTLVIDLATGVPFPEGKPGLLRHFDLANVDSVMAIQTEDLGQITGQGFELLGRAPGAEPRGCSRPMEHA